MRRRALSFADATSAGLSHQDAILHVVGDAG